MLSDEKRANLFSPPHPYKDGQSVLKGVTEYSDEDIAAFKLKGWEIVKGTRLADGQVRIENQDASHSMLTDMHGGLREIMRDKSVVHFWAAWENGFFHCFELAQAQSW